MLRVAKAELEVFFIIMVGSDFVGGVWVGMSNKVSDMRCAEVERKQFSVMLRT